MFRYLSNETGLDLLQSYLTATEDMSFYFSGCIDNINGFNDRKINKVISICSGSIDIIIYEEIFISFIKGIHNLVSIYTQIIGYLRSSTP